MVVVHTFTLSTQEAEAGRQISAFEVSQGYAEKLGLK